MAEYSWWVGIDWGSEEHQVSIVDAAGKEVRRRRVKHEGEDLARLRDELVELCANDVSRVALSIEATSTALVELLIDHGFAVFSINPKQLDRFRDRHSMAGAKDDRRDAFVLATSLRTDQQLFRRIELDSPAVIRLRQATRARAEINAEIRALGNKLSAQLLRYFPQIQELGSVYVDLWLLELLELVPSPAAVKHLKRAKVEALLRRARVRRVGADELLATLRKAPLPVAPGVADAAADHAQLIVARLKLALEQRKEATSSLEVMLQEMTAASDDPAEDRPREHRDAAILLSLPGTGSVVGATMLAEGSKVLAARDYQQMRALCGVAPITMQSGKQSPQGPRKPHVEMRRACNKRLRNAVHHWAGHAVKVDPRCHAQYLAQRARGHRHARALRGVGDRLLAMLFAMLRSNETYDPTRRLSAIAAPMPA
jgi:transposase